jgi:hypothetical protein
MDRIQMTIETPNLHTLHPLRQRDKGIMALATAYTSNRYRLAAINNCRHYLQVHTLAEITTMDGTEIMREAYTGHRNSDDTPMLHTLTQSKLNWPQQTRPPERAWRIWKKLLRPMLRGHTLALKHKLSEWNHHKDRYRSWTDETVQ